MAKLVVKCESCGAEREVDDRLAGSVLVCASCEGAIRVPLPDIGSGSEIGGFVLEKQLGFGAMGEVWLARQTAMDRLVALKLLSREFTLDSNFVDRFMKEVRISAKMDHPNVVTAFDAGSHGDIHYLAISYVDGRTLEDMLEEYGALPERDALEIIRDVAKALRYAWEEFGIIHRDIKPANIMIDRKGVAKLMDMGISKSVGEEASLTMTGTIIGTPYYMSPEQGMGERNLDFRSDIYSLGATLYHLVTGSVPFDAGNALGIVSKHITEPLPSPLERNADLSAGCVALLDRMMAKERGDRHESWGAVIEDMDAVLSGGLPAVSGSPGKPLEIAGAGSGKGRFSLILLGTLGALALGLLAVLGIFFFGGGESSDATSVPDSGPEAASKPAETADSKLENPVSASKTPEQPKEASDGKTAASAGTPPGADEEKRHSEMWKFAMDFAKKNEGRFDLVISNFEKIRESLAGTKYELMANVEIGKLEEARKKAADKVFERLEAKAAGMAAKGNYAEAAKFLRAYSGEYASETGDARSRLAEKWEKAAAAAAAEAEREAEKKRLRDALYLQNVAFRIIGRDYKRAKAALDAPECPDSPAVDELAKVVDEFSGVDGNLVRSFAKDVGKSVAIGMDKGLKVYKISRVKNGKVYYYEKRGGAVIQKPLDLKSLSPAEKAKRGGLGALAAGVASIVDAAGRKDAAGAVAAVGKLPATPGGAVFKDAFLSIAAKKKMAEALKALGLDKPTFDAAVVAEKLRSSKPRPAKRRLVAAAIAAFERRFGDTLFVKSHADLLAVLKKVAKGWLESSDGGNAPSVPSVESAQPKNIVRAPAAGGLGSPEEIKATLRKINPDYDGSGMFRFRNGVCVGAILPNAKGVDDRSLAFLAKLPLMGLDLSGTSVRDLSPLAVSPRLKMLNLSGTKVESLAPLKGLGLFNLDISRTGVSDLSPLEGMPLRELRMFECPVEDYSVLATLKELRILEPANLWNNVPGKEGTRNPKPRRTRPKL